MFQHSVILVVWCCAIASCAAPTYRGSDAGAHPDSHLWDNTRTDSSGFDTVAPDVSVSVDGGAGPDAFVSSDIGTSDTFVPQGVWTQVAKIVASDGVAEDRFGQSVAVDGDNLAVGASLDGERAGSVYLWHRSHTGTEDWVYSKKLTPASTNQQLGNSVALSGDTLIAGAYGGSCGRVYIFGRDEGGANNWGLVKELIPSDCSQTVYFGAAVAISGDTLLVGAHGYYAGAAFVYQRNRGGSNNWGEVKRLEPEVGNLFDNFGISVGLSGDTAIVGATEDNDQADRPGSAHIFMRGQGGADNWGLVKRITSSDGAGGDFFGLSVAISGSTVMVGAPYTAEEQVGSQEVGSVYVFQRDLGGANHWGEAKILSASDWTEHNHFGYSLSLYGETVVVGAGGNALAAGAAYVYRSDEGGDNNWGEVGKLTASDSASWDIFGSAVSLSGSSVAIAAVNADNATGSVYLFEVR